MRRSLDFLYNAAGVLAALFMVGTLAMVVIGVAGRLLHFHLPGTDAYAGYCMAGAGFLALAHTFKRGEHIRVTLLLERLTGAAHRALTLWAYAAGAALALLFAYYSVRLAWQSWDFHDISTSRDATPLWIPQSTMAIGTVIFAIAMIDELVLELRGKRKQAAPAEMLRNE